VICLAIFGLVVHLFPSLETTMAKSLEPKNQSELYGIYHANYWSAKERLILKADLTYVKEVTSKDSTIPQISSGTWRYDNANAIVYFYGNYADVQEIELQESDDYQLRPQPAPQSPAMVLPVTKIFGNVYFHNIDQFDYHKKRGSEKDPAVAGPGRP